MNVRKNRYFVCDFETTVYRGQTNTEVWASACVELFTEDVFIMHSIDETLSLFEKLNCNIVAYYHNLKFDGEFWMSYILNNLNLKLAYKPFNEEGTLGEWLKEKDMPNNSYKYSISDKGMWYSLTMKINNNIIELRDSLKLLPFSVKEIGKAFDTKHKKLEMEYSGFRYSGCIITDEEREYIKNDVLVVKEALETMFTQGHSKITIGSCCLSEYKKLIGKYDWSIFFPDLTQVSIDSEQHKYKTADEYIRKSYKGGWCYLVKEKANKVYTNGITADVNSLYPSMMSSESGNRYPLGKPKFWTGNFIPDEAISDEKYYFVRIKTRFKIKENYLPFIQIKGNYLYRGTEALETSDYYDRKTKKYYRYIRDIHTGEVIPTTVEMTLTMTDYILFREHYDVEDFEILDGCWFYTQVGIFDDYIEKYKKIKIESKGAMRTLAKLFLNNLYGKMASSTDSSFKVAYKKDDDSVGYYLVPENNKSAGYIPVGSAITSYARNFTIRTAQMNYYGKDKRGFIYADTDSIHCDLSAEELKGLNVHPTNFCCWALEANWDEAIFVRQKTYIEHVTHEDLKEIEKPYYNIKCAGMPESCKKQFNYSLTQEYTEDDLKQYDDEQKEFIAQKRKISDFKIGLKIFGKLVPKRILGGVLLVDTYYEMREQI